MPVTQTCQFAASTGLSFTSASLFAITDDTIVQTQATITEATNRKGIYTVSFTDVPAGDYMLVYFIGTAGIGTETYRLADSDGIYLPLNLQSGQTQPVLQIRRPIRDQNPIFFEWEDNDTTFTPANQKVGIGAGPLQTIVGSISFAYTSPLGRHMYRLAYNSADRPAEDGIAIYWINEGSTEIPIALTLYKNFDPAADVISNVTNVTNVTGTLPGQNIRDAMEGRWTDEEGNTFDLSITDVP